MTDPEYFRALVRLDQLSRMNLSPESNEALEASSLMLKIDLYETEMLSEDLTSSLIDGMILSQ